MLGLGFKLAIVSVMSISLILLLARDETGFYPLSKRMQGLSLFHSLGNNVNYVSWGMKLISFSLLNLHATSSLLLMWVCHTIINNHEIATKSSLELT